MADTPSHSPLSHLTMAQTLRDPIEGLNLVDCGRAGFLYVMARRGRDAALAGILDFPTTPNISRQTSHGTAMPTAPGEWALIAGASEVDSALAALRERLAGLGYVSDQSHSRVKLRISGQNARRLMAKGIAIDLHPSKFSAGHCAQTSYGDIGVLIHQVNDTPTFDLYCYAGFAETLWMRLKHDGEEYSVVCHRD